MKKKAIFLSITVLIMIAVITLFVINISAASKASFTYDVVSDWGSGAVVNLTITNEGSSDIDGWKAKMDFDGDQEIETMWSGSYTQEGKSVILENSKWNSKIASGESVTLGFTIKYSGTNSKPSNIELVNENEVLVEETVDEEASETTDEQSNENSVPDTSSSENDLSKELLAFPGAEGYGKNTVGGRGGDVYEVTTLNPTGAGSLGEAIGAKGARTVVFRVAGTITGNFQIRNDNITIAGQTAPGDGICIKGKLSVDANDVIVRYIRVRPNAVDDSIGGSHGKENVILDHVSASWSADEVLSIYRDTNLTIQYSMITEACSSDHKFGGIWGNYDSTYHHNLLAHNSSRNPRWATDGGAGSNDFRNNVIYNWGYQTCYGGADGEPINMVANYYKPGPGTTKNQDRIAQADEGIWYVADNFMFGSTDVTNDNWKGVTIKSGEKSSTPWDAMPIRTETAEEAYETVLETVGCSKPNRDSVDKRIIEEVRTGTATYGANGLITTPDDVGGWPDLASGTAPSDSDHDGMPDSWEVENDLNPNDSSDGNKKDSVGYTMLERYLNSLDDL